MLTMSRHLIVALCSERGPLSLSLSCIYSSSVSSFPHLSLLLCFFSVSPVSISVFPPVSFTPPATFYFHFLHADLLPISRLSPAFHHYLMQRFGSMSPDCCCVSSHAGPTCFQGGDAVNYEHQTLNFLPSGEFLRTNLWWKSRLGINKYFSVRFGTDL